MNGHETDMNAIVAFEQELQDALAHLYDPVYRPSALMREVLNRDLPQGAKGLRAAIIQAIEALKPEPDVPDTARVKRVYGMLYHKYVQNLSQEETAERLGITSRHLRREQAEVVHALALYLWEKRNTADATRPDVYSQVKEELASLQEQTPSTVANVTEVVESAVALESGLTARRGVRLEAELPPRLVATIHPVALRQVLITIIGQLTQHMSSGQVILQAEQDTATIRLSISGEPVEMPYPHDNSFITEILDAHDATVAVNADGGRVRYLIELRAAEQTILVVDDNLDLAHLYRRYAMGTRYNVVHVALGQRALEAVEVYRPVAIVLDVMLPDIDGWLLLAQLREHPASRDIPVIVCSVVREEELARALGARQYLQKPVQRQHFIQALRQALGQAEVA